jgi:hypothetical protein
MLVKQRLMTAATRQFSPKLVCIDAVGAVAMWTNKMGFHRLVINIKGGVMLGVLLVLELIHINLDGIQTRMEFINYSLSFFGNSTSFICNATCWG